MNKDAMHPDAINRNTLHRRSSLDLGPHPTTLAAAYPALYSLWQRSGLSTPPPTRHLLVITHAVHLPRLKAVLGGLQVTDASRQSLLVLGEQVSAGAQVSLVPLADGYAERLEGTCTAERLLSAAEALIRPGLPTHVWWACDHAPPLRVLRSLGAQADKLILDTVSEPLPALTCPVTDLSWVRSEPWRALVDARLEPLEPLRFERAVVSYSGDPRPARLFAAWLTQRLDWADPAATHPEVQLTEVQLTGAQTARQPGDLAGVELSGAGTRLNWAADGDRVQICLTRQGTSQTDTVPFVPLSLTDGLSLVLTRLAVSPAPLTYPIPHTPR